AHAFHYYLPAMLIASLGSSAEVSAYLVNALLFYFSPSHASCGGEFAYDDTDRFNFKLRLLSPQQRDAIVQVFERYVDRGWVDEVEVQESMNCLCSPLDDAQP
ncbi:MAG: hypothetical protein KDA51_15220, partial [Planctomycetales bacterium]|nr:hypothetical protein [Planctomycetales bacterium]